MPIDDLRPSIDWGKYQTLTLERRDNGVLLITIAEPDGCSAPTLTRRHTEISYIWRDFADDPDLRVAVITGRGERFWTVEGTDGIDEMLANPGNYDAHGIVNCDKPIVSATTGRPWDRDSWSPCSQTSASPRPTHA